MFENYELVFCALSPDDLRRCNEYVMTIVKIHWFEAFRVMQFVVFDSA